MSGLPVIAVHGGAWDIPENLWEESIAGVKEAAIHGYKTLLSGGSAVDAVENAVVSMEKNAVFDAGRGSVLTSEGTMEGSALIMRGDTLKAGGIAAARNLLTPIKVARKVMEETQHVLIVGEGANKFAKSVGISESPAEELLTEEGRRQLEEYRLYKTAVTSLFNGEQGSGHDTVGCVAVDSTGLLSCGTSTGGITGQMPGRVGDSPLVGCGGYADNTVGAVSTTGHGESIATVGLAHRVTRHLEEGSTPSAAANKALHHMRDRLGGRGGCVVLSTRGDVGVLWTTKRMPWAYVKEGVIHWGMNEGVHCTEEIKL